MENPVEVQLPGRNHFLITLCVDKSGKFIPPTLLDDVFLDLRYGSAIESVVSRSCITYTPELTHLVSCSIASHTD